MLAAPRSLFSHLVLVQLVYGVFLGAGFLLVLELTHTQYHLEATQRQSLGWAQEILARYESHFATAGPQQNIASRQEFLEELGHASPAADYYLVDGSGKILASSVPSENLIRTTTDMTAVQSLIKYPQRLPVTIEDPAHPEVKRVFSAAQVEMPDGSSSYLILLLRGQDAGSFHSVRGSYVFRESTMLIAVVSIFAFGAAVLILLIIVRPIRTLSAAMELFRRDGTIAWSSGKKKAYKPEGAELDRLSWHFNDMASQIAELLHRLRADDRKMREMFANISHDLRTPLAIIQGCLETMQAKGGTLTETQLNQLTSTAVAQASYLGRLIEAVFELAKLQNPNYQLRCEAFSIPEAVQDIAMKFSVKAARRGIAIRIVGENRHIYVMADVLLIERALDNLIDNALRHAAGADEIVIKFAERTFDVEIMVSDNGPGMPEAVLNRMVGGVASYPGASDKGFGLGLSIVMRILELHGSDFELVTEGNKGTVFRFFLKKTEDFCNPTTGR